jgi:predicted phosphodiesterase
MDTLAWLHLSDWHHKEMDPDRTQLRNKLLDDIKERTNFCERLAKIDMIFFSGDISFSGQKKQFESAKKELIDPISECLGKDVPVLCVPGNHDIDRKLIRRIPAAVRSVIGKIDSPREDVEKLLSKPNAVRHLNGPLKSFYEFSKDMNFEYDASKLFQTKSICAGDRTVGIICINSAWHSARYRLQPHNRKTTKRKAPHWWDYGLLKITEAQLQSALNEIGRFDLGIVMMHHPIHWINEAEQAKVEQMLFEHCHVVLHGHEHRPNTTRTSGAFGELVFVPAGASFNRRMAQDPMFTNAYNFCVVDLQTFSGTVYHRYWSEEKLRWKADDRFWAKGESQFFIPKSKKYDQCLARASTFNLNKHYFEFIYRRVATDHQVTVDHNPVTIAGETFMKAHVTIKILLGSGTREAIMASTKVDRTIANHQTPEIQRQAFRLIKLLPKMQSRDNGPEKLHLHEWYGELDEKAQTLHYEFETLDDVKGFWFFTIKRFTEKLTFRISPADENLYEYDFIPIGGFPPIAHQPGLKCYEINPTDMILPDQGYLVAWKPRHAAADRRQQQRKNSRPHPRSAGELADAR